MATERTVTARGAAKQMTLGELRQFVAGLDDAEAAESTPIRAKVTWGGGLQEIQATAVRFGDSPQTAREAHGGKPG